MSEHGIAGIHNRLNQTTKGSYTRISVHPWVACAMRTKRGSDRYPCAQRTLCRVSQCHVVRFSHLRRALVLLLYGADGLQQALGSLRGVGIDREGRGLLCVREGFERRELAVQDGE